MEDTHFGIKGEGSDHNANAKVERKNRKLLGIFRTCLIEATQGSGKYKELWCVGLEHAAMASNQAPESGEKSPAARIGAREWHGISKSTSMYVGHNAQHGSLWNKEMTKWNK